MINKLTLLALVWCTTIVAHATTYQTIDIGGGVIKWSTDGGVTDCNCNPSNASNSDVINIYHPISFPDSYFNSKEIKAQTNIDLNISGNSGGVVTFIGDLFIKGKFNGANTQLHFDKPEISAKVKFVNCDVVFSNEVKISFVVVEGNNSNIEFNGKLLVEDGNPDNNDVGKLLINNGGNAIFYDEVLFLKLDAEGSISAKTSGSITFDSSMPIIKGIRIESDSLGIINVEDNLNIENSEIWVGDDVVCTFGSNIFVKTSIIHINSSNMDFGSSVIFDEVKVEILNEGNTEFGSNVSFGDKCELFIFNGGEMKVNSGATFLKPSIHIENGGILTFIDAQVEESNFEVGGLLNCDSNTRITKSEINITSTGIVDLLDASPCDFTDSKVNGNDAQDILSCGQNFITDPSHYNIWNGSNWSLGFPPNNVGMYAEVKANYSTSSEGTFLCGHLTIDASVILNIGVEDYIEITQVLNNFGLIEMEDKASVILRELASDNVNNGIFEIEAIGQISSGRYNVWSTPVIEEVSLLNVFSEANPCDIYAFEAHSQTWKYDYVAGTEVICLTNPVVIPSTDIIYDADGFMNIGRGYFVPGNDQTEIRVFYGEGVNGFVEVPIKTTDLGDNESWFGDDWNLIGNPYPSAIDLNDFWTRNAASLQALTDGVYFWIEQDEAPFDQFASYLVWNYSGGTYNASSPNEMSIVQPGHGFWVYANDPSDDGLPSYEVQFSNSMRTHTQAVSSRYHVTESDRHRLWINISNDSSQFDQILVATHPEATDDVDLLYDARKNYGGEPIGIATIGTNSKPYTIQAFAPRIARDTSVIELAILAANTSDHYIYIDSSKFYLDEKRVFLLDIFKGTEQELTLKQNVILDIDTAGLYEQRFYLKVTNSHITAIEEIENGLEGRIWAYGNEIFYDSFESNIAEITVYDLRGVMVYQSNPNNRNSSFELQSIAEGIYIVKFTDDFGNKRVERLFIK